VGVEWIIYKNFDDLPCFIIIRELGNLNSFDDCCHHSPSLPPTLKLHQHQQEDECPLNSQYSSLARMDTETS